MRYLDRQLYELQQKVVHKSHLEAQRKDLQEQCEVLRVRMSELAQIRQDELKDVERLEKNSLSAFYYKVIGKKEEKLEKERREAYEAAIRYDSAVRELESIEHYIKECNMELAGLTGCEEQYEICLKEKEDFLKRAGGELADGLWKLEQSICYEEQQEKEIQEAVAAGKKALRTVDEIIKTLDSAEGWSTLDMLGGGLFTDMAKYEDLDKVQELAEKLQKKLHRLKSELADVEIPSDIEVNIDSFMHFADYFFDGLFADLAVREQILLSQKQAEDTRGQIQLVLARMEALHSTLIDHTQKLKAEREKYILQG